MSGAITSADRARFTEGDCHFLARAIWLRTGWPMRAVDDEYGKPDAHAWVLMPDGRALDVCGPCTESSMLNEWGWGSKPKAGTFLWSQLREFSIDGRPTISEWTYRRAHVVAERLLAVHAGAANVAIPSSGSSTPRGK